jgi:hypothetical protein
MTITQTCSLCESPIRVEIDRILNAKGSAAEVLAALRRAGEPEVSPSTVSRHRRQHNIAFVRKLAGEMRETVQELGTKAPLPTQHDLAILARDRAIERMLNGEIEPTMTDGLKAQELLDKRVQRGADRDLLYTISVILSGGPTPLSLAAVVEGEWHEEQAADEGEFRQLTAGAE